MLHGKLIVLRAPEANDKSSLARLRNDIATQTELMALPRANSIRRVDEWIEGILGDPASLFFSIAELSNNECVGFIQLRRMDFVHGTGELGVCLDIQARGRGLAGEAIHLLELHASQVFRIRKVSLQVLASNSAGVACYEKCGYRTAGTLQQHFYHKGDYHDVLLMEHLLARIA